MTSPNTRYFPKLVCTPLGPLISFPHAESWDFWTRNERIKAQKRKQINFIKIFVKASQADLTHCYLLLPSMFHLPALFIFKAFLDFIYLKKWENHEAQ